MKKLHVFGLAIVAMFAFGSLVVSPALAVSKILANGVEIAAELPGVSVLGELILGNLTNGAEVLCEGIFDGAIAAGGTLLTVNEVLMDNGELLEANFLNLNLESLAGGDDVECLKVKLCEQEPVLVVAFGLPWDLIVELVGTEYVLDFPETAGYSVECRVLGFTTTISCTDKLVQALLLLNAEGDLAAEFNEPEIECCDGSIAFLLSDVESKIVDADGALLTLSE